MTSKTAVEKIVSEKTVAVVGVSRSGKKFGNSILKELKKKNYTVYPVNPHADTIDNETCYRDLASLPDGVGSLIVSVPKASSLEVVQQAEQAGIRNVWLQQGSESEEAIRFCSEKDMNLVHGECVLMFAEPVESIHKFHRWIWKLLGKLPG